jgi:hypothetical protein
MAKPMIILKILSFFPMLHVIFQSHFPSDAFAQDILSRHLQQPRRLRFDLDVLHVGFAVNSCGNRFSGRQCVAHCGESGEDDKRDDNDCVFHDGILCIFFLVCMFVPFGKTGCLHPGVEAREMPLFPSNEEASNKDAEIENYLKQQALSHEVGAASLFVRDCRRSSCGLELPIGQVSSS